MEIISHKAKYNGKIIGGASLRPGAIVQIEAKIVRPTRLNRHVVGRILVTRDDFSIGQQGDHPMITALYQFILPTNRYQNIGLGNFISADFAKEIRSLNFEFRPYPEESAKYELCAKLIFQDGVERQAFLWANSSGNYPSVSIQDLDWIFSFNGESHICYDAAISRSDVAVALPLVPA